MKVGTYSTQAIEVVDTKSFSQSPMNLNQHANIAENPFNQEQLQCKSRMNLCESSGMFCQQRHLLHIDNLQYHDSKPSFH